LGAVAFLPKPVRVDDLLATIAQHVKGTRVVRRAALRSV
jgi:FixJ family two-component response regulator